MCQLLSQPLFAAVVRGTTNFLNTSLCPSRKVHYIAHWSLIAENCSWIKYNIIWLSHQLTFQHDAENDDGFGLSLAFLLSLSRSSWLSILRRPAPPFLRESFFREPARH